MGQPTEFVLVVPFNCFDLSVGQKLSPHQSFKNHLRAIAVLVLGFITGICDLSRWFSTEYSIIHHIRDGINTSVGFL